MKIGILAAGSIAHKMADTLVQMKEVECYAVGARTMEKAKQFANQYGCAKAYGSYEELVKDEDVSLVYIASPHSHHYEHIKLCLLNGKHVLCEKAFTVNAKQAREVFALAKEKGLLLAEAMWVRYMPMVTTLKEFLARNCIGNVSTVTANLYYPIEAKERIMEPSLAGGALLDVGVYTLTFAALTLGENLQEIHAVALKTTTGVDAQTNITLCYPEGKMAVLTSGIMSLSDRLGVIYGDNGYIIVHNINNFEKICVYNKERVLVEEISCPTQISGYEYQVLACKQAIEEGKLEVHEMPHASTIKVMEWMDEVRRQIGLEYPCE